MSARATLIEAMIGLDAWSGDDERSEWIALIDAVVAEEAAARPTPALDATMDEARHAATYAALMMILQGTPRPLAAEEFIRYLEQDGFTVAALSPESES